MPFRRTRTGCLTCREDGYKCDEQKPHCARCIRLRKVCKGYGLKLKWPRSTVPQHQQDDEASSKRPRRRRAAPMALTTPGQHRPGLLAASVSPRAMSSGIPPQHAYLLHHWSTTLASLVTMAPTAHNEFHAYITPMLGASPSLASAVCAMAAHHLSVLRADDDDDDPSLLRAATQHQLAAVSSLRRTIRAEGGALASLATILVLQMTDRLFTTTSCSGVNHLQGAKAVIERAGPRTWACGAGAFLLGLCHYHDAVASVSRRTPPVLGLGARVPPADPAAESRGVELELEPMLGLRILWAVIGQISSMCGGGGGDQDDRAAFDARGAAVQLALERIDARVSREGDAGRTVHAYREAAHIYLHRVWHGVGSPHPATLQHAREGLGHLLAVPVASPLASTHAWPLWTAACETIDGELRGRVRRRVRAMYASRHLPSLRRLGQDIEDVWAVKDRERTATGIDRIDCVQAILAMRQRGADLA
ncbi:fungal-specific transcription factor domain-containing protein [Xylaria palmicola]|nr:fungal-specific transcription factor domain-containing protein [Xylaria palmicola]